MYKEDYIHIKGVWGKVCIRYWANKPRSYMVLGWMDRRICLVSPLNNSTLTTLSIVTTMHNYFRLTDQI